MVERSANKAVAQLALAQVFRLGCDSDVRGPILHHPTCPSSPTQELAAPMHDLTPKRKERGSTKKEEYKNHKIS